MIGRAFEKLSDDKFINLFGTKVNLPVPEYVPIGKLLASVKDITIASPLPFGGDIHISPARFLADAKVKLDKTGNPATSDMIRLAQLKLHLDNNGNVNLNDLLLAFAADGDEQLRMRVYRTKIGDGVQAASWPSSSRTTT